MLTPEYLEACADSVLGIYDELNIKIVEDIARRIAKTGTVTDSAKWQIKQVQEAGKLMDEITHEVASITGFSDAYVKELFNDADLRMLLIHPVKHISLERLQSFNRNIQK